MRKTRRYKMRAECGYDVGKFLMQGGFCAVSDVVMETIEPGFGDVCVSFSFDGTLKTLRANLSELEDCHVMVETVAPIQKYTGERRPLRAAPNK